MHKLENLNNSTFIVVSEWLQRQGLKALPDFRIKILVAIDLLLITKITLSLNPNKNKLLKRDRCSFR